MTYLVTDLMYNHWYRRSRMHEQITNHPIVQPAHQPHQNMINLVLLGPPGAGKGAQSQKLIEKHQLVHITPGELLREQVKKNTTLGQQVAKYINAGQLAPSALVTDIVATQLAAKKDGPGFLFDGFPRTTAQAVALEALLSTHDLQIDAVILLEVPEAELLQRIKSRAQIAGRTDDQDEAKVTTRMRIYHEETLPLADYYAQQNKLFKVDGVGEKDTVFERIVAVMAQRQLDVALPQ